MEASQTSEPQSISPTMQPGRPLAWPDNLWTCDLTGIEVRMDLESNLRQRESVLTRAESDAGYRKAIATAAAMSLPLWVNLFGWTYKPQTVDQRTGEDVPCPNPIQPMILWPVQHELMGTLQKCVRSGGDLCIDKSREMGATWQIVYVFHHEWMFVPNTNFLELSRKQELVDGPRESPDPTPLLAKHDFINEHLPSWMLPRMARSKMHLSNLTLKSAIVGESTNNYAGSGGRYKAGLLDEFGKMDNGMQIVRSLTSTAPCRIFNSTPNGIGSPHYRVRVGGKTKVFVLGWWDHPEKAQDRHTIVEGGVTRWHGKWRQAQIDKAKDPRDIRQEVDIDHIGSSSMFFDAGMLNMHAARWCREALHRGEMIFSDNPADDWRLREQKGDEVTFAADRGRRRWSLWIDPDDRTGRAPANSEYVMGIDISHGEGASNSIMAVYARETMEKVAEFADPHTPPEQLAREAVKAGLWFGGTKGLAFMIWESNGPGAIFGRQVTGRYEYPWVYFQRDVERKGEPKTKKWGWTSTSRSKEILLGDYRIALSREEVRNRSHEAVTEALLYAFLDSGEVAKDDLRDLSTGARAAHGDRVIADALACMGLRMMGRYDAPTPPPVRNSVADVERRVRFMSRTTFGLSKKKGW